MRKVKIKWDTEGIRPGELHLPYMVEVPEVIEEDNIADWLSDQYGFCVEALSY